VLANQLRRAKEELLQEVSDRLQHVFTWDIMRLENQ
jgi:hypothetical protein